MLTDLHAKNFRRYDELSLHLPDDAQLVAVTGPNGSGKSTLVEMILFALYGESRHGRRNLDRMVRRGAEYEGLEVELGFVIDQTSYRVRRKLKNGVSSAVLYGDGTPMYESPTGVNDAIEQLFGMDALSFKLATVARQKELDGLASLTPAKRIEKLSRLLRLDAIKQARQIANDELKSHRDRLHAMDAVPDLAELSGRVDAFIGELAELETAKEQTAERLADVEKELADLGEVTSRYDTAVAATARAEATVSATLEEIARLDRQLEALTIPAEPAPPDVSRAQIEERRSSIERAIAQAEARKQSAEHLALLAKDRDQVAARLEEISSWVGEHGDEPALQAKVDVCDQQADTLRTERDRVSSELETARGRVVRGEQQVEQLDARRDELVSLDAECPTCQQPIGADHAADLLADVDQQAAEVAKYLQEARSGLSSLSEQLVSLDQELSEVAKVAHVRSRQLFDAQRFALEVPELEERRDAYDEQLANVPAAAPDMRELYRKRSDLKQAAAAVDTYDEQVQARSAALSRRVELTEQHEGATARLADARTAVEQARPSEELASAHGQRGALETRREQERATAASVEQECAVTHERVDRARADLQRAETLAERRRGTEHRARVCSLTKEVLDESHNRISGQVRPALEGAVSELLARMSSGRFSDVKLDESYELTVKDETVDEDGSRREGFYPLSEFSGGEQDLIALAMRLAIAGVVAERHGSNGPGFVVLDETFGSQDADRRTALLSALRGLRSHYGQIILISHVPGIDASADLVLNVSPAADMTRSSVDAM